MSIPKTSSNMKSLLKTIKTASLALFTVAGCCLSHLPSRAQQAFTYTQYMNDLTSYNTAYGMARAESYISLLGKRQWAGIEGAPQTFLLNTNIRLDGLGSAVGAVLSHNELAVEKLSEAQLYFAKGVRLSQGNYLAASLQAGVRHYNANYSGLDPYDPKFTDDILETNATLGLGIMFYNPDLFYLGVSLPRLSLRSLGTASVESQRHQGDTWYASGALLISLDDDFKLKPASLVSYTPNLPLLFDISTMMYIKNQFGLGVNYRSTKEVAGLVSLLFGSKLQVGYSYQSVFGAERIGRLDNATHEITLGYRFGSGGAISLL